MYANVSHTQGTTNATFHTAMLFAIFANRMGILNRIWKLVDSPFPEIYANVSHAQGTTKASFDTAVLFAILKLTGPITFIPGFLSKHFYQILSQCTSPQVTNALGITPQTASFHTAMLFAFLKFDGLPFELLSHVFSRRRRWRQRRRPCIHSSS